MCRVILAEAPEQENYNSQLQQSFSCLPEEAGDTEASELCLVPPLLRWLCRVVGACCGSKP